MMKKILLITFLLTLQGCASVAYDTGKVAAKTTYGVGKVAAKTTYGAAKVVGKIVTAPVRIATRKSDE